MITRSQPQPGWLYLYPQYIACVKLKSGKLNLLKIYKKPLVSIAPGSWSDAKYQTTYTAVRPPGWVISHIRNCTYHTLGRLFSRWPSSRLCSWSVVKSIYIQLLHLSSKSDSSFVHPFAFTFFLTESFTVHHEVLHCRFLDPTGSRRSFEPSILR